MLIGFKVKKSGAGQVEKMVDDRGQPRVSGSQNNGVSQSFQETTKAVSGHSSSRFRLTTRHVPSLETTSIFLGSEQHRSPAVGSPSNSSDEGRVHRRMRASHLSEVRASGALKVSPAADLIDKVLSP